MNDLFWIGGYLLLLVQGCFVVLGLVAVVFGSLYLVMSSLQKAATTPPKNGSDKVS